MDPSRPIQRHTRSRREGIPMTDTSTLLHILAEIFFVSVGIFAIWAIHDTIKGK
jgi:hypothetical protein